MRARILRSFLTCVRSTLTMNVTNRAGQTQNTNTNSTTKSLMKLRNKLRSSAKHTANALPLEARHTLSLEMAKRRRLSVPCSIFLPKGTGAKSKVKTKKPKESKVKHPPSYAIPRPTSITNAELRTVLVNLRVPQSPTAKHADVVSRSPSDNETTATTCARDMPDLELLECVGVPATATIDLTAVKEESNDEYAALAIDETSAQQPEVQLNDIRVEVMDIEAPIVRSHAHNENGLLHELLAGKYDTANELPIAANQTAEVPPMPYATDVQCTPAEMSDNKLNYAVDITTCSSQQSPADLHATAALQQPKIRVKHNLGAIPMPLNSADEDIVMDLTVCQRRNTNVAATNYASSHCSCNSHCEYAHALPPPTQQLKEQRPLLRSKRHSPTPPPAYTALQQFVLNQRYSSHFNDYSSGKSTTFAYQQTTQTPTAALSPAAQCLPRPAAHTAHWSLPPASAPAQRPPAPCTTSASTTASLFCCNSSTFSACTLPHATPQPYVVPSRQCPCCLPAIAYQQRKRKQQHQQQQYSTHRASHAQRHMQKQSLQQQQQQQQQQQRQFHYNPSALPQTNADAYLSATTTVPSELPYAAAYPALRMLPPPQQQQYTPLPPQYYPFAPPTPPPQKPISTPDAIAASIYQQQWPATTSIPPSLYTTHAATRAIPTSASFQQPLQMWQPPTPPPQLMRTWYMQPYDYYPPTPTP